MARGGYVMHLGTVPYAEAWELQRSLAGAVSQGAIPDTVLFPQHPPAVTLRRRTAEVTGCGLEDAMFTPGAREAGRPVTVDDVRPHAVAALEEVFGLELEPLPAEDGAGLWAQPVHAGLSSR